MVRLSTRCGWGAFCGVAVAVALCHQPADIQARAGDAIVFTLNKDFIEKYRNLVTIEADMTVDVAGKVHAAKDDGDMHFSGRAKEVGLPFVAEIMNAKGQPGAVKAVRAAEGNAPIKVKGAWRLWCEHAGKVIQKQGSPLDTPFADANPAHVFEIHPVTAVEKRTIENSVGEITGFKYKDPNTSFTHYENVGCKITDNGDTVTIRTGMAGFNMPEFIMESVDTGDKKDKENDAGGMKVADGRFLFAAVRDLDGELLVRKVRCAFIKDTEAEVAVRKMKAGQRLHVVGIPRISLTLIHWRIEHKTDPEEPLTWNLPYEIIVVAVLN